MSWHVDPEALGAYARGESDVAEGFSIEAHLLACDGCKAAVAPMVAPARLDAAWAEIVDRLDAPQLGPVERLLRRAGLPEHLARLLAATPSLTVSWLVAVALALAFAVAAAHHGDRGVLLFECLAALLPVAGVAAAFGPGLDPAYEVGVAAPFSSARLLLIRAAAVLVATTLAGRPGGGGAARARAGRRSPGCCRRWRSPLASLALATYISPRAAFAAVTTAWLAIAAASAAGRGDAARRLPRRRADRVPRARRRGGRRARPPPRPARPRKGPR